MGEIEVRLRCEACNGHGRAVRLRGDGMLQEEECAFCNGVGSILRARPSLAEDELAEALYDLARCREALVMVVGRLTPIPPEEPGGGTVCWRGYFARGEVEFLRGLAGEERP